MKICETERLILRTLTIDDAPFYLKLVNEPSFIEGIGDRGIRTLEHARQTLETGLLAQQANLGYSLYMVSLKDGGAQIGMAGLVKRPTLDQADLGYAYLPAYFGQGYASEAGRAVIEHARRDIGLPHLLAITSPGNRGSIAVLTKLGFSFERLAHLTETDTGTNVYRLPLA